MTRTDFCASRISRAGEAGKEPLDIACTSCSASAGQSCEGGVAADIAQGCPSCRYGMCVTHAPLFRELGEDPSGVPAPAHLAKTHRARPRRRMAGSTS